MQAETVGCSRSFSMCWSSSHRACPLEQALPNVDHIVRLDSIGQLRVDRPEIPVPRLAADLQPPICPARRHTSTDGERLHHGHGRLSPIGSRALDLTVDIEDWGALYENRVAALQLNIL